MNRLFGRFFKDQAAQIGEAMRATMAPEALLWLFSDWVKDNAPEYNAAPELLEACREAVDLLMCWHPRNVELNRRLKDARPQLFAAIAKAEDANNQ